MKRILILMLLLVISPLNNALGQQYGWVDISGNLPDFPYDTAIINGGQDTVIAGLSDVFFINDTIGWITTSHPFNDSAAILHTSDGGASWEVQMIESPITALEMFNAIEGYAASFSGYIYHTTTGGDTWNFHVPTFATLNDITFPRTGSTATGYACGDNGALFSVTSSGANVMISGVVSNLKSITFPTDTQGWACGQAVIIKFSGGTWQGVPSLPPGTYNAIYFTDNQKGWAVGNNGIIIHTTDGQNWVAQTNPDPQNRSLYKVFFLNYNEGWAVGFNGIILHTTDGGTNWNNETSGLSMEFLISVQFTSSTNGYVVGNNKTLLKYTQLSGIENKEPLSEINIYPTPTTHTINIECPTSQNLNITLFNLMGEQVMQRIYAGTKEEIDISALPAGMYFARITVDKQMIVKKIIKQ